MNVAGNLSPQKAPIPFRNTLANSLLGLFAVAILSGCASAPPNSAEEKSKRSDTKPAALPLLSDGEAFTDDFSTLNGERWYVSHGWKNGNYLINDWRRSQAQFGGPLSIVLEAGKSSEHLYSSGEIQSRKKYGHGYFETTLRAAKGSGLLTGFFTYTGPPFGKPWNEIDIEFVGARPNEVLLTYHFEGQKVSHSHLANFDTTAEFHTYGFDWQPGYIEWYIDGEPIHRTTGDTLPLPNERQKIFLTLLGSGTLADWLGTFDPSILPAKSQFQCAGYSPSVADGKPCWDARQAEQ